MQMYIVRGVIYNGINICLFPSTCVHILCEIGQDEQRNIRFKILSERKIFTYSWLLLALNQSLGILIHLLIVTNGELEPLIHEARLSYIWM